MGIEDRRSSNSISATNNLLNAGPYVAKIVNNVDPLKQGSLEVQLLRSVGNQSIDDKSANQEIFAVRYLSPFYGATDVTLNGNDPNDFNETQKSYGFWFVPPDAGSLVLVIFAEGDPGQGFWIGCVQDAYMNHMIPGIAASKSVQSQVKDSDDKEWKDESKNISDKYGADFLPVAEINRIAIRDGKSTANPSIDDNKKAVHPMADTLLKQGLQGDTVRGTHTSSARRESPSNVYGISTPGPLDKRNKAKKGKVGKYDNQITKFVSRLGGHTLVMDDGNENFLRKYKPEEGPPEYADVEGGDTSGLIDYPKDESFRIRTRTGHQILLHNSEDLIYIGNASGTAWIELTSQGKIDIYASDSVSIRTESDFNFVADRDINLHAGRSINLFAETRINLQSIDTTNIKSGVSFHVEAAVDGSFKFGGHLDMTGANALDLHSDQVRLTGAHLVDLLSGGNFHATAHANLEMKGDAKALLSTGGDLHLLAGGVGFLSAANANIKSFGSLYVESGSDTNIRSGGPMMLGAGGKLSLGAGGVIAAQGTSIYLNGGTAPTPPGSAATALQAVEAVSVTGNLASVPDLVLFPLPGIGSVLTKRAPTAEPWAHHENTNPSGFTSDLTDREQPDMPYTKDGDRLSIKSTTDANQVPAQNGGTGADPGTGISTGAGNPQAGNRKNKFIIDKSTSTTDPNDAVAPALNDAQIAKIPSKWLEDKEFLSKCQELASKYQCQLKDILGCAYAESGASMSPAIQNKFGYTGIIQIGDDACVTMTRYYKETITTSMLKRMSRAEYMKWAERYWDYWIKTIPVALPMTAGKLYQMVARPGDLKRPDPNTVIGPVSSNLWINNAPWRSGGSGPVTPASIQAYGNRSAAIVDAILRRGGAQSTPTA
jgi:uncharacterized protein (DUF2345 family)